MIVTEMEAIPGRSARSRDSLAGHVPLPSDNVPIWRRESLAVCRRRGSDSVEMDFLSGSGGSGGLSLGAMMREVRRRYLDELGAR